MSFRLGWKEGSLSRLCLAEEPQGGSDTEMPPDLPKELYLRPEAAGGGGTELGGGAGMEKKAMLETLLKRNLQSETKKDRGTVEDAKSTRFFQRVSWNIRVLSGSC